MSDSTRPGNVLDLTKIEHARTAGLHLTAGSHTVPDDPTGAEACAMNLIAWATTGEQTDMPECVHPLLARLVHKINDDSHNTEDDRWRIVTEAGPLLVGSDAWPTVNAVWVIARAGRTAGGLVDALRQGADLTGANLTRANLTGAYLTRAYLAGANLTGANLTGAEYTQLTIWPKGFDPKAAGAVEVQS